MTITSPSSPASWKSVPSMVHLIDLEWHNLVDLLSVAYLAFRPTTTRPGGRFTSDDDHDDATTSPVVVDAIDGDGRTWRKAADANR